MKEQLSRRGFLKAAISTVGALTLGEAVNTYIHYDPVWKIEMDGQDEISWNEATQLALRFDRLHDMLPEQPTPANGQEAHKWALEILPMFEYNNIVSFTHVPQYVGFVPFPDGSSHNHTAGRSDCFSYAFLNERIENDVSNWYEEEDWPVILAHELAHIQQGNECGKRSSEDVENAAQLMSLEVISSLVNGGNKKLIRPLLSEFRSLAMSSAYYIAMNENRVEDYKIFRQRLLPGEKAKAKFERSKRYWESMPWQLREILYKYNYKPLDLLLKATKKDDRIDGLAIPPRYTYGRQEKYIPIADTTLVVDDIDYFLRHAEGLTKEAVHEP